MTDPKPLHRGGRAWRIFNASNGVAIAVPCVVVSIRPDGSALTAPRVASFHRHDVAPENLFSSPDAARAEALRRRRAAKETAR